MARLPHVVIVGGGYAGVLAANRLAGRMERGARVTLVSDGDELVHRIRLHEIIAGRKWRRYPLAELLRPNVTVRSGRVVRVERALQLLEVDGNMGIEAVPWDYLVIATGSRTSLATPGAFQHAAGLTSLDAALRAREQLGRLGDGCRVTVIGGGLTAIEVVSEIAEMRPDLRVSMLASDLAPGLSCEARCYVRKVLADLGVTLQVGAKVARVTYDRVELQGGIDEPAALSLWAAGFTGRAPFASDLPLDGDGRVIVDATLMAAGGERVWVAGDAAAPPPGLDFMRMGCAAAMPMAAHTADNVAATLRGRDPQPFRFGFMLQCVSLGRRRGVVQLTDRRDAPTGHVFTGRTGAWIKESINRFVILSLRAERRIAGFYRWPRSLPAGLPSGGVAAALPAGE